MRFSDWLKEMEPLAYGALELKPWEFSRLQPHELLLLAQGYQFRQSRDEALGAYFVSLLLNVSGKSLKRQMSVKDILAPLQHKTPRDKEMDKAYLKKTFKLDEYADE